jgi:hypothetical protein
MDQVPAFRCPYLGPIPFRIPIYIPIPYLILIHIFTSTPSSSLLLIVIVMVQKLVVITTCILLDIKFVPALTTWAFIASADFSEHVLLN